MTASTKQIRSRMELHEKVNINQLLAAQLDQEGGKNPDLTQLLANTSDLRAVTAKRRSSLVQSSMKVEHTSKSNGHKAL